MNVVREEHVGMRAASKLSHVSLRRHAMEKPFTVCYEGTDVAIPGTVKIHFKNVVSPGSQLKRAYLRRDYCHHKAKEIDNQGLRIKRWSCSTDARMI